MSERRRRPSSDAQEQFVPPPPINERTRGDLKRVLESIVAPGMELDANYLDGVFDRVNEIRWFAAAHLTSVEQDRALLSLQTQVSELAVTLRRLSPQFTSTLIQVAHGRAELGEANFILFADTVVKIDKKLTSLIPTLKLKDPTIRRVKFYTHLIGEYLYNVYADIMGRTPKRSVSVDDGHEQGPFVKFLSAAFRALGIKAVARSQARQIIKRMENKRPETTP